MMDVLQDRTYGFGDRLPDFVDLGVAFKPTSHTEWSWTVRTVDRVWNHVTVACSAWVGPAGGPGKWVLLPGDQVRMVVCNTKGVTVRHPVLDGLLMPNEAAAYRVLWDAGLLGVTVFPPLNGG